MNSEQDMKDMIRMELKGKGVSQEHLDEAISMVLNAMERRGKGFDDAYRVVEKYIQAEGKEKAPD